MMPAHTQAMPENSRTGMCVWNQDFASDRLMFDQCVASGDACFAVPFGHRRMAR
jgi:hypothetical protein